MRTEAFVLRRAQELARSGLWAPARLPKVAERPRPRAHWDGLLDEMQWMAVDFYQVGKGADANEAVHIYINDVYILITKCNYMCPL